MRIENDLKLDYSNVLLRPKRSTLSSRKEVNLNRSYTFRNSKATYTGIPIMAANMDGVGTWDMNEVLRKHGMLTAIVKHYSISVQTKHFTDDQSDFAVYSMGVTEDDLTKFRAVNAGSPVKWVCIDVANGYSERFIDFVARFRDEYPDKIIMAGNVVTGDITEELILRGADIIKVGIGPGSVCTTRIQTGVGYPQLSAVMECADAAHGLGGHIIADGGCTCPGDVAKAFAGGADFVMLGGMLAGHDEGGGDVVTKYYRNGEIDEDGNYVLEERKFVEFYGMSSEAANEKHFGGLKEYRSSEGREVMIPYKGEVANTIQDLLGGIRSTCTYVGAKRLKDISKCTTFIRCSDTHNRIYENG
jgi:GMP reductase